MNQAKFIYVFSEDDKDTLLSLGYNMVKSDKKQNLYVFENTENATFASLDMTFVLSDTLTFA